MPLQSVMLGSRWDEYWITAGKEKNPEIIIDRGHLTPVPMQLYHAACCSPQVETLPREFEVGTAGIRRADAPLRRAVGHTMPAFLLKKRPLAVVINSEWFGGVGVPASGMAGEEVPVIFASKTSKCSIPWGYKMVMTVRHVCGI